MKDSRKPKKQHRVDRLMPDFETPEAALKEEQLRVKAIGRRIKQTRNPKRLRKLRTLEADLKHNIEAIQSGGALVATPASAIYVRAYRVCSSGELLHRLTKPKGQRIAFVTLIPRGERWRPAEGDLKKIDATRLRGALRKMFALHSKGATSGWMYFGIDGEQEPNEGVIQLHAHGVVTDDLIEVIEKMKEIRTFKSDDTVRVRIRVEHDIKSLPRTATYAYKNFWCARPIRLLPDGTSDRTRRRQRIRGRAFVDHLLWLHRYGIKDLTMIMGMRMTKKGLRNSRAT
jgi:hypothetical protein